MLLVSLEVATVISSTSPVASKLPMEVMSIVVPSNV